jgi:ABC-type transport system substrate-binding protein
MSMLSRRSFLLATISLAVGAVIVVLASRSCTPRHPGNTNQWVLHDSVSSNPTSFDPIRITDAVTTTLMANVYEGLVKMQRDGTIGPAIAQSWETSPDGLTWQFKLRPSILAHPGHRTGKAVVPLEAADVVFSLTRCITDPDSLHSWLLVDLVAGAADARAAGSGSPISGIRVIDPMTIEIELTRPFPLLDRLVMAGAWVYPKSFVEIAGSDAFNNSSIGTGPYRLVRFLPDDRLELQLFRSYWDGHMPTAPSAVTIHIEPDPLAALTAFRRGDLDIVQLDLETISAGRQLGQDGNATILTVTANELDYLVLHLQQEPFDDIRIRRALNLAIDRQALLSVLSGMGEPAYGFLPPPSRSYRGLTEIQEHGFALDLAAAEALVAHYLADTGQTSLTLELTADSGELPQTIAQMVAQQIERLPNVSVTITKQTWPELLQSAFSGQLYFYRFWWNVVTPGEDVYFLFYMPGQAPPHGLNFSFYDSTTFADSFTHAFSELDPASRTVRVQALENQLISDAVAVPLLHRKFSFALRPGLDFPINAYLARPYQHARNETP